MIKKEASRPGATSSLGRLSRTGVDRSIAKECIPPAAIERGGGTMIRTLKAAIATVALLAGAASAGFAAPCKDAKRKFTECPPVAAAAPAASKSNVTKDAKGKCHVTSGPKKGQLRSAELS
jgi:hypothetical protein